MPLCYSLDVNKIFSDNVILDFFKNKILLLVLLVQLHCHHEDF